jgi:hypothetical protein
VPKNRSKGAPIESIRLPSCNNTAGVGRIRASNPANVSRLQKMSARISATPHFAPSGQPTTFAPRRARPAFLLSRCVTLADAATHG